MAIGIVANGGAAIAPLAAISTTSGRPILQRFQPVGGVAYQEPEDHITKEVTMTYHTARGRSAIKDAAAAALIEAAELVRPQNFVSGQGVPLALNAANGEVHPCDAGARYWNSAGFVARSGFFRGSVAYYEALTALENAIAEFGVPLNSRRAAELLRHAAAECTDAPPEPTGTQLALQYPLVA